MARIKKAQAGLTASNKRVGPVDPTGAWTRVQEENLPPINKKTAVSLTKDKQQGATKMKRGGKIGKIKDKVAKKTAKAHLKSVKVKVKVNMEKPAKAKDGKWIQKAINPKHKGYCTPMTKKTCTPRRKALAITLRKMAKSRKGK